MPGLTMVYRMPDDIENGSFSSRRIKILPDNRGLINVIYIFISTKNQRQ